MGSTKYQYFATAAAALLTMSYGISSGWVSPYLPYLSSDETLLDAKLTTDELSLIAALICAGGLVGNLLFGWLSNRIGRRYPLMFIAVPQIVGWLLILYARNAFHLYVARFMHGLCGGGAFAIVPTFVSEIADDSIRGTLGSLVVVMCSFGTLLAFVFGEYCHYDFTPIFTIATALVFLCAFYFCPETPVTLLKMNRVKEAEQSIRFYRDLDENLKTDWEILEIEMNKLQKSQHTKCASADSKLRWSDFTTIAARKAMLIGLVLMILNQFCGCFAMINYTATIFKESGSSLSPNASAIVVGAIQLLGSYVSTLLVDRAGRKLLVALSAAATGMGLACLGTYLYLKSIGCGVEAFAWIPIFSFSFVVFFACWGILTLPFLILSEIFPEKIKDAGTSICLCLLWVLSFVMVKYFPMMSNALGMHGTMFMFTTFSMAGAIFVMTMMPETKGKSFEEIMELLSR